MTQLEDPRLEWLSIQEAMLRDYLHTAQEALEVSFHIFCNSNFDLKLVILQILTETKLKILIKKGQVSELISPNGL